ncbi:MAG: PIG-L family deacetylase [Deltaproteobacteria bacterium]|nr:PIG-L family deacetylase [Deltaproteobacteria bacterium]
MPVFLSLLMLTMPRALPEPPSAGALALAIDHLQNTGRVLYVAAHPDDENTRLLAWLVGERGVDAAYLSMTRGGGGQNLIGTEQAELLGYLRTLELLAARAIDGARQMFTRARDFGYSKNPEETLRLWGHDRALADVVRAIRRFRPDIIVTRFSTEGPNHGHHTASALLAAEAFRAAADPKRFPELKLPPWQADRLLENVSTWNRPPDADMSEFLRVDVGGYSPLLGESWGEMAARSRTMHKTQGFGSAPTRGTTLEYFAPRAGTAPTGDPFAGIDFTWARVPGSERLQTLLAKASADFDLRAPHQSIPTLVEAYRAMAALPPSARRDAGLRQLEAILVQAAGLWLQARAAQPAVGRGEKVEARLQAVLQTPAAATLSAVVLPGGARVPVGATLVRGTPLERAETFTVARDAAFPIPHWLEKAPEPAFYRTEDPALIGLPDTPAALRVTFDVEIGGLPLRVERPLEFAATDRVRGEVLRRVEVMPAATATAAQGVLLFPEGRPATVDVVLRAGHGPAKGTLRPRLPAGWRSEPPSVPFDLGTAGEERAVALTITPPAGARPGGELELVTEVGTERAAWRLDAVDHPHLPQRSVLRPSRVTLVPLALGGTDRRVGIIPGSGDKVGDTLRQVGYSVTELDPDHIEDADLSRFDVVLAGVRAWNVHPRLRFAHDKLMAWVDQGGLLVVQYNTVGRRDPDMDGLGPYPMSINHGRVTDETAAMVPVRADHPLLTTPNRLVPADYEGWVQERGLYFAETWDPKYEPVFRIADPGEPAQEGALLVAHHGKGAFIYTGLAFFRELPAGVPGAVRLLANILSYAR